MVCESSEEWKEYLRKRYRKYGREYRQRSEVKKHRREFQREYYRTHFKIREYEREYVKDRRHTNIQFCLVCRLRALLYIALNTYGNGKTKSSKKYGIIWDDCIEKLVRTKPIDFNKRKYNIDHIRPLSSFDLTDVEQVKQAFAPENLQWLLAEENIRKSNVYV